MQTRHGFTLVELSIVLVIIGLIAAGVLVGRDLIKAAQIRATISQLDQFNTATMAFKDKYENLPGDITFAQATQFNFTPTYRTDVATPCPGYQGVLHGNGVLESCGNGDGQMAYIIRELGMYWRDLSSSGMIPQQFVTAVDDNTMNTNPNLLIPKAKIGNAYWVVFGSTNYGGNYFLLSGITLSTYAAMGHQLGAADAYSFDTKLDDGLPMTGKVRVTGQLGVTDAFAVNNAYMMDWPGQCLTYDGQGSQPPDSSTVYRYNFNVDPNNRLCSLSFKASF